MGLLVNIVTADEDEIEAVGESQHPVDEWSGIELRDVDTAKLATLHCLLVDADFEEALAAYEPVYAISDDGPWVLQIPEAVAAKLADLEEEALEAVGEELAASEEFELAGWPAEEVLDLVVQLADLARLADAQDQTMLVWMHPLRT